MYAPVILIFCSTGYTSVSVSLMKTLADFGSFLFRYGNAPKSYSIDCASFKEENVANRVLQQCEQPSTRHSGSNTSCWSKRHALFGTSQNSLSLLAVQELLSLRSHLFFLQGIQQNV